MEARPPRAPSSERRINYAGEQRPEFLFFLPSPFFTPSSSSFFLFFFFFFFFFFFSLFFFFFFFFFFLLCCFFFGTLFIYLLSFSNPRQTSRCRVHSTLLFFRWNIFLLPIVWFFVVVVVDVVDVVSIDFSRQIFAAAAAAAVSPHRKSMAIGINQWMKPLSSATTRKMASGRPSTPSKSIESSRQKPNLNL